MSAILEIADTWSGTSSTTPSAPWSTSGRRLKLELALLRSPPVDRTEDLLEPSPGIQKEGLLDPIRDILLDPGDWVTKDILRDPGGTRDTLLE